jgi:ABC-2 type transport system ATP-binding protein
MARRIGLAQALINDPDLLILDEPTSGLDPIGAKLVKDIIVRIGRVLGKTILLSSHLLADVEEVCDRMTILYGGKVQVTGPLDEVLSQRDRLQISCERLEPATLQAIQELVAAREGKQLSISPARDRLETLFLRIVHEATARRVETAGSATTGQIAAFLGEKEQARAVLDSLVRVDEEPAAPAPAPPEETVTVDDGVLRTLTASGQTAPQAAPEAARPAAPRPPMPDVDRGLLGELTQDTEPGDQA